MPLRLTGFAQLRSHRLAAHCTRGEMSNRTESYALGVSKCIQMYDKFLFEQLAHFELTARGSQVDTVLRNTLINCSALPPYVERMRCHERGRVGVRNLVTKIGERVQYTISIILCLRKADFDKCLR